jgi:hypothetical protein
VLGAAEGMMRDRLAAPQQNQPTPFRGSHSPGSHRTALDSASREKLNVDVESLQAAGSFFLLLAGVGLLCGLGVLPLVTKGWSTLSVALVIGGAVFICGRDGYSGVTQIVKPLRMIRSPGERPAGPPRGRLGAESSHDAGTGYCLCRSASRALPCM